MQNTMADPVTVTGLRGNPAEAEVVEAEPQGTAQTSTQDVSITIRTRPLIDSSSRREFAVPEDTPMKPQDSLSDLAGPYRAMDPSPASIRDSAQNSILGGGATRSSRGGSIDSTGQCRRRTISKSNQGVSRIELTVDGPITVSKKPPTAADFNPADDDKSEVILQTLHKPRFGIKTVYYKHQILNYSITDATHFGSLFHMRGTFLSHRFIWVQIAALFFISGLSFLASWGFMELGLTPSFSVVYNFYNPFTKLLTYILSLYVSLGLSRWWAMRTFLSSFWGSFQNLLLIASCYLMDDTEENIKFKSTLTRYGLLSHALIYKNAQGKDDEFDELLQRGMITQEEAQWLLGRESKAQLVCGWVGQMFENLRLRGKLPAVIPLNFVQTQIYSWQNSIMNSVSYRITQLPLPYIHLIAFMTKITLLMMAVCFGAGVGISWFSQVCKNRDVKCPTGNPPPSWGALLVTSSVQLLINGLFFQGMLNLQQCVEDPFGDDEIDFPEYGYHHRLRKEAEAILQSCKGYNSFAETAASNQPVKAPALDLAVKSFLSSIGFDSYSDNFAKEKIAYGDLMHLDGHAIKSLGVPVGHAFEIAKACKKLAGSETAQKQDGTFLVKL